MLAGCSTGTAEDSRRFQSQEAEKLQQLPDAQATVIAEQFHPDTPTPEPTRTPSAGVSELALTSSISGDGSPGNTMQSVPARSSQTIYAVVRISNIQPGQVVSAVWRTEDGGVIASVDQTPGPSSAPQWVSFPVQLGGSLAPGTYSVAIFIGDELLESLAFTAR